MEKVDLSRYEDAGRLGSGADYEVRAAVDRETGKQVVLKRTVPQMVSRNMHGSTEARTERTLQVCGDIGSTVPLMVPILGYTDRTDHDCYFGETLGQDYLVIVEERAAGIPLFVGDPRARITGVPVGAAQNLFALFPLVRAPNHSPFSIHQQLLDLEEGFLEAGFVLLDLGPQNIFYQPGSGRITVIDWGALAAINEEPSSRGKRPKDIHDFYLEMLKYYTTPQQPPTESSGYRDAHGLRPVVRFEEELDEMARDFGNVPGPARNPALYLIAKIRERSYTSLADFRSDLMAYLNAVDNRNSELRSDTQVRVAWTDALGWLRGEYWQRFLFDPDSDLSVFA